MTETPNPEQDKKLNSALEAIAEQIKLLVPYEDMLSQYTPLVVEPELFSKWLPLTILVLKKKVCGNFVNELTELAKEPVAEPPDAGIFEDHLSPNSFNKNRDWCDRYKKKIRHIAEFLADAGVEIKKNPDKYLTPNVSTHSAVPAKTNPNNITHVQQSPGFIVRSFRKIHGWTGVVILGAIGSLIAAYIWKFILHQ